MKDWFAVVARHFTTVLVVIALGWTIAKPHAEDFIQKTVNERITRIEQNMDKQEALLRAIIRKLDIITNRKFDYDNRL